jgi:hypothetical protein
VHQNGHGGALVFSGQRSRASAGREMIDLLAVEEPKPKPVKIRAVSYEAAIDQLFKPCGRLVRP